MSKRHRHTPQRHPFASWRRMGVMVVLLFLTLSVGVSTLLLIYSMEVEQEEQAQEEAYYAKEQSIHERLRQKLQESPPPPPVVVAPQEELPLIEEKAPVEEKPSIEEKPTVEKTPTPKAQVPKTTPKVTPKIPPLERYIPKPKLAIIIDDVSYAHEVAALHRLGLRLNFSFFPPSPRHPDTAHLAAKEPFYMVHLPMEAMGYDKEEELTLRIDDTKERMQARLATVKRDFPKLTHFNNHTGSRFTSDYGAVERLMQVAWSMGLDMVDSRTTAQTQLPALYDAYGKRLLARDIFLDHESEVSYICGQMALAVKKAHENGSAIAIGHPRKNTIAALQACKDTFESVQLVWVKELH